MLHNKDLLLKSVNVHRSNNRHHAILQKDNTDILLIQEPSYTTVATLRSNTDPQGENQMGVPVNDLWDCHLPPIKTGERCKAVIYTNQKIRSIVRNNFNHPLARYSTTVLEITDNTSIDFQIINIYHDTPPAGSRPCHALQHLLAHELDHLRAMLLISDFNTHSPLWSTLGSTPSSWANDLTDWMGDNGLTCINPPSVPTWRSRDLRPSILDLVLANESALMSAQIGDVTISWEDSLGSDHTAVALTLHPITSLALVPTPTPSGYRTDDEHKDSWMREFAMSLPSGLPYAPPHCTEPYDQESTPERRSAIAVTVHETLRQYDAAIEQASRRTLPPKRMINPKGARWWNDACSAAHTLARSAVGNEARCSASKALNRTIGNAKRE